MQYYNLHLHRYTVALLLMLLILKNFKEKLISNYGTTTAKVNAINQICTYYGF